MMDKGAESSDLPLLALKMWKRSKSQGKQEVSRSWIGKETNSSFKPSGKNAGSLSFIF